MQVIENPSPLRFSPGLGTEFRRRAAGSGTGR